MVDNRVGVANTIMEELRIRLARMFGATAQPIVRVIPRPDARIWDICIGDGGPNSFYHVYTEGEPFTAEIADAWVNEYRLRQRGAVTEATGPVFNLPANLNEMAFTYMPNGPLPWEQVPQIRTEVRMPATVTMRTQAQEIAFRRWEGIHATGGLLPGPEWEEYQRLMTMTPYETVQPVARTIEQETRWQALDAEVRDRIFTQAESTEYNRLSEMAPCPTPIPPRIHVRVHRDTGGSWSVTVKVGIELRDLPTAAVIKSLLPPADKHFIPGRQGRYRGTLGILRTALSAGLPAQSLHDALRAWVMATENAITSAESTFPVGGLDAATANLLRAQPVTLEAGGMVYRLVPVHQTDVRPLIARVRAKTVAAAQVETTAMKARAVSDARITVQEAERNAARVRLEAEALIRQAGTRVPDWVRDSHRNHYWDGERWHVEMLVSCQLTEIRYTVQPWNRILYWNPIVNRDRGTAWYAAYKIPVWFRLSADGNYDRSYLDCVQMREYSTTHITRDRACMSLQAMPALVNNLATLKQLEACLSRGMQVVNLNSPLGWDVADYWPAFKEQLPAAIIAFLNRGFRLLDNNNHIMLRDAGTMTAFQEYYPQFATWNRTETIAQEQAGMFNVSDPVIPLAVPIVEPHPTGITAATDVVIRGDNA
jgi:hypothetical protein